MGEHLPSSFEAGGSTLTAAKQEEKEREKMSKGIASLLDIPISPWKPHPLPRCEHEGRERGCHDPEPSLETLQLRVVELQSNRPFTSWGLLAKQTQRPLILS